MVPQGSGSAYEGMPLAVPAEYMQVRGLWLEARHGPVVQSRGSRQGAATVSRCRSLGAAQSLHTPPTHPACRACRV